jgi:hypothetical protein
MSPLVPRAVREELLARIISEANEVDWDHLAQADKTAALSRWIEDPEVGGVLRPLLGGDAEIRVWLKEVALKRRSRLRNPGARVVAIRLFPQGATVEDRSEGIKPPHCVARVGPDRHFVCWSDYKNAKNLFWAALNALASDSSIVEAHVVILEAGSSVTPPERQMTYKVLATHCGLSIAWITI